jgi:hypothetical protein
MFACVGFLGQMTIWRKCEDPAKRDISMYGPPLCRKRKVRIAGVVCAYVYGLIGAFNDPGPGWNALRSGPI